MTSKQAPVAIVVTLLRQLDVYEALTTSSSSFRRKPESRGSCLESVLDPGLRRGDEESPGGRRERRSDDRALG